MRKIGFIGVYDKTYLILSIAKILNQTGKKILVVDNTENQKIRYVVPVINPTKSYVTEFEGIDVAVGFENTEEIKQYLGLEENEQLDYDMIMIDTDNFAGIESFDLKESEKIYYVTSFDAYSLKKGIEVISQINVPLHMTRLFYSKQMLKEEVEYFDYLALGVKVIWNEEKIYFLLENGDLSAMIENQRVSKIKLRNLSNEYKENVIYLVNDIDDQIEEKKIRTIIKNL
jgi:hypothetical protein